ncbi:MAG: hypothetical protein DWQ02_01380 [Bacteroidetes bacterium]|nr:MAG: hypothetical protein DWQ02_01380 [Bacteroidota bacterium]
MKFLIQILIVIVTVLALLPIRPDCVNTQECTSNFSCNDDENEDKHHDFCSPFCGHFCCGITIDITEATRLDFQSAVFPEKVISFPQQIVLTNFIFEVWHPPKKGLFNFLAFFNIFRFSN